MLKMEVVELKSLFLAHKDCDVTKKQILEGSLNSRKWWPYVVVTTLMVYIQLYDLQWLSSMVSGVASEHA